MAPRVSLSDVSSLVRGPEAARDSILLDSSLKGYNDFKKQLKEFDPQLRKAMDAEIRRYLKPVITDAKSLVPALPLSGWRTGSGRGADNGDRKLPNWNPDAVRKGLVIRQGQKRKRKPGEAVVSAWELRNMDGAGAAFGGAGRIGGRSDRGRQFIASLALYHGKFPRLLWRAWGNAGGDKKITNEVLAIVKFYESKLERELRAAKG